MLSVLFAAPAVNAPALVSVAVSVRSYTLSLAAAPVRVMAFCVILAVTLEASVTV